MAPKKLAEGQLITRDEALNKRLNIHYNYPVTEIPRREVLGKFGKAAVATFLLGAEVIPGYLPFRPHDAVEYGPNVAGSVMLNPREAIEAYRLWKEAIPIYRNDIAFRSPLQYKEFARNFVVGLGDSNLYGANGRDREASPLQFFYK